MSTANTQATLPDKMGRFGEFGGRFVPETLMSAIEELEREYAAAQTDEAFQAEMRSLLEHYVGRPTPLYYAENLSAELGGAQIYIKREDLAHTGAHRLTTRWGRRCLRSGWARTASSRRRVRGSTGSLRRRCARCSSRSASSIWARRTSAGRR